MLGREGIINTVLMSLQFVDKPMKLLYTSGAVYLAMVQILLPVFVISLISLVASLLVLVSAVREPRHLKAASHDAVQRRNRQL